ncbi:precorrin-6y C5,15-methyltransferase (decarboxylating) subunit CbiE [Clostridiaceae bacterium 14S0207]|nr:precorrin-6y C5,15-methyltransferase (decarboxylating) subunit CbiE [Clostridiaceae bacterium 14S0207]
MKNKTTLYVIGLGPGHRDYILPKAMKCLTNVSAIVGFSRAMESIDFIDNNKIIIKSLKDLKDLYENGEYESLGIIASGDPCYYGITNYIKSTISKDVKVVPGISSFQYLASKLALPWQNAYVGSMHGREEDFLDIVKEHKLSFWLVDNKFTPQTLCKSLVENNIRGKAYVGANLSYEYEQIFKGNIEEVAKGEFSHLSVLVIERD